jgi:sulfonate transport system substrate-binding protein
MRVNTIQCVRLALILFVSAIGNVANADPTRIRVAWIVPVTNITSIMFAKEGVSKHNDKSYTIEPIRFQGSTAMITALASGDIDVALLGFSSLPLAIVNAGLDDARIITDEIQDGAEGYYSQVVVVRKEGPIHKVADLKGKIVATNGLWQGMNVALNGLSQ